MLRRTYYICECGFEVTKGEIVWGLIELDGIPHPNRIMEKCNECGSLYRNDRVEVAYHCPNCTVLLIEEERLMNNDNAPEVMGIPYRVPIHSDALGIMPDQVAEHKKLFPNISIDDQNRPVFTNTKDHQEYLDKCGVRKQTQKTGKSKGKVYSYPGCKCS